MLFFDSWEFKYDLRLNLSMPKLVSPIGISMLKIVLSTPLSPSWNFRYVFTLPFVEISQENKLSPLEILENYVTLLGNSKVKHKGLEQWQRPIGNPTWFSFEHLWSWKICFLFSWTLEFILAPSSITLKISCPRPSSPCLDFFWNKPRVAR